MRNMSFFLTSVQIANHTKTVTRRLGWDMAIAGMVVQPVLKGQGLKKGERVTRIGGPIQFTSVHRERLAQMIEDPAYGKAEAIAEGFPDLTGRQFVEMFCDHNKCEPSALVNRIQFRYL